MRVEKYFYIKERRPDRRRLTKNLHLLTGLSFVIASEDWHYTGEQGQDKWPELFDTCTGKRQSPIDIRTSAIVVNSSLKIGFLDHNVPLNGKNSVFVNDGHSAKLLPNFKNTDHLMKINVSSYPGINFALLQFHFHWSETENTGTEHAVNGKKFAAEVHFVYQNTKYHSISQAIQHADGLVVLAAFFQVSETRNVPFDPLFRALPKIEKYATNTTLDEDIDAMLLLPKNLDSFYMYSGSLTTPPCAEAVTFVIFKEKLTLSRDQLSEFRKLHYIEHGAPKPILMNVRNLQEVNKRTIYATEKSKASVSKAMNGLLALFVLLIATTSRNKLSDQLVL